MGRINGEKNNTWSKKERRYCNSDSRGCRNVGLKSAELGCKPKRTDRANSSESDFFKPGTSITGGILSQLILEYQDQVASKKGEIEWLEARINQFKRILEELDQRTEIES